LRLVRASEWWQYKLAPALVVFFATALVARKPIVPLWPAAATLLVALAVCAAYVSIINDLTDRDDDIGAGKRNRQLTHSRAEVIALLMATIAGGTAIAWFWRDDIRLVACYAGSWLAFALYSVPPFRFKTRGLAGAICDAAGAHLFPALTAVSLAMRHSRAVSPMWVVAVGVWSFCYGLRGILWHQLLDHDFDLRARVSTFAVRHREAAIQIGRFAAFPAECLALSLMLWQIGHFLPVAAFGCYVALVAGRVNRGALEPVIVQPKPRCFTLMQEYYDIFLPIALLGVAVAADRRAILLLAAFVALFAPAVMREARELAKLTLTAFGVERVLRLRTPSSVPPSPRS